MHIFESRFKKINTSFQAVIANFATEDIHRFRVEIKKLRAFLHAINSGRKQSNKLTLPKRLKKFYSAIGAVRNLQLQQERIIKMANDTGDVQPLNYLNLLHAEANAHIRKAKKIFASPQMLKKEEKKLLHTFTKNNKAASAKKFFSFESALLKKQFPLLAGQKDETLHSIRKILKDVSYIQPYISNKTRLALPVELSNQDFVKSLTDLLGDFQDACTGLLFLQPFYLDQIPENERILLMNIKMEWQDDKEKMKWQFCELFGNRFSSSPFESKTEKLAILN